MTAHPDLLVEGRETAQGHPFALVTVNRPKALNALNRNLVETLARTFEELGADRAVEGIVLTGAGDRAFVAGADISELRDLTSESAFQVARRGQEVMRTIEGTGKPVIAAIGGYALGGGLELALACHLESGRTEGEARAPRGEARRHPRIRRNPAAPSPHWKGAGTAHDPHR